ncbi:MAG: NYN domain-containing protein [Chlamydiales bacterium]
MLFLLDGYNILFSLVDSEKTFSNQRQEVITFLQKQFASLKLSGMLVFDGFHRSEEESGRGYESPLEIIFSPKGQNADSFILEQIALAKNPKDIKVVTNDAGLTRQARASGAHVLTNTAFLEYLKKAHSKATRAKSHEKDITESPKSKERLQKIFEDRFRQE